MGAPQGTYPLAKVGTPCPGQNGGEGVPQGTYPPAKVGTPQPGQDGWRGTPRYLTLPPTKVGTPPPPPGIGQHMEYLIRCGRYASCVHVGGLSCSG